MASPTSTTQVVRRGTIQKPDVINGNRIRIAFYMQKAGRPLTHAEIARETGIDKQLVALHLPQLIGEGICASDIVDGKKYFMLQPFFYDEAIMSDLFSLFGNIIENIAQDGNHYFDEIDVPIDRAIKNCLQTLIHFFKIKALNGQHPVDASS